MVYKDVGEENHPELGVIFATRKLGARKELNCGFGPTLDKSRCDGQLQLQSLPVPACTESLCPAPVTAALEQYLQL